MPDAIDGRLTRLIQQQNELLSRLRKLALINKNLQTQVKELKSQVERLTDRLNKYENGEKKI